MAVVPEFLRALSHDLHELCESFKSKKLYCI